MRKGNRPQVSSYIFTGKKMLLNNILAVYYDKSAKFTNLIWTYSDLLGPALHKTCNFM